MILPSTMRSSAHLLHAYRRGLRADPAFREDSRAFPVQSVLRDAWLFLREIQKLGSCEGLSGYADCSQPYGGHRESVPTRPERGGFSSWRQTSSTSPGHVNVTASLGETGIVGERARLPPGACPASFPVKLPKIGALHRNLQSIHSVRSAIRGNLPVDKAACSYAVLWNALSAAGGRSRWDRPLVQRHRAALLSPVNAPSPGSRSRKIFDRALCR